MEERANENLKAQLLQENNLLQHQLKQAEETISKLSTKIRYTKEDVEFLKEEVKQRTETIYKLCAL